MALIALLGAPRGGRGDLPARPPVQSTPEPAVDEPPAAATGEVDRPGADVAPAEPRQLFSGKVVMLLEALKRRKISTAEDEWKGQVVLETDDGRLIPIVPDWRGRAFFQDERLRNRKVELAGYRPAGTPYLKVLMVFTFNDQGERQYTDYWCDICSIPMYEIQPCECCQEPIRLRFEPRELPEYLDRGGPDRATRREQPPASPADPSTRP
ncbi:MAG TPA: hypothetical protein VML55_24320 [Planctomycetaceae bacterium]|nr:hypothetical protein [Planctomycetaceae bacterium]